MWGRQTASHKGTRNMKSKQTCTFYKLAAAHTRHRSVMTRLGGGEHHKQAIAKKTHTSRRQCKFPRTRPKEELVDCEYSKSSNKKQENKKGIQNTSQDGRPRDWKHEERLNQESTCANVTNDNHRNKHKAMTHGSRTQHGAQTRRQFKSSHTVLSKTAALRDQGRRGGTSTNEQTKK